MLCRRNSEGPGSLRLHERGGAVEARDVRSRGSILVVPSPMVMKSSSLIRVSFPPLSLLHSFLAMTLRSSHVKCDACRAPSVKVTSLPSSFFVSGESVSSSGSNLQFCGGHREVSVGRPNVFPLPFLFAVALRSTLRHFLTGLAVSVEDGFSFPATARTEDV